MATTQTTSKDFVDTGLARLIALVVAIAIAALLIVNWGSDIKRLASGGTGDNGLPQAIQTPESIAAINPELQACLDKRVGDVDQMKADGVLSDSQYADFVESARSLCYQTNPSQ